MKLIPALATICALLLPSALHADTFEGKLTMSVDSGSSKNGPQVLNMTVKEGKMRTDIATKQGTMGMVMDFEKKEMIIMMPAQRMYMIQSMAQPANPNTAQGGPQQGDRAPGTQQGSIKDTGIKETICGYSCSKYEVTGAKSTAEIWATSQLGTFNGFAHGGNPMASSRQAPPEWENIMKGGAFFPMRVISNDARGGSTKMEVTSVEKMSVPDSAFLPPDGWRKFDMGAMMGGMGGFPGQRPSSGDNN